MFCRETKILEKIHCDKKSHGGVINDLNLGKVNQCIQNLLKVIQAWIRPIYNPMTCQCHVTWVTWPQRPPSMCPRQRLTLISPVLVRICTQLHLTVRQVAPQVPEIPVSQEFFQVGLCSLQGQGPKLELMLVSDHGPNTRPENNRHGWGFLTPVWWCLHFHWASCWHLESNYSPSQKSSQFFIQDFQAIL